MSTHHTVVYIQRVVSFAVLVSAQDSCAPGFFLDSFRSIFRFFRLADLTECQFKVVVKVALFTSPLGSLLFDFFVLTMHLKA